MNTHRLVPHYFHCAPLLLLTLFIPGRAPAQPATNCTPAPENIVAWLPGDGHSYDVVEGRFAVLQNGAGYGPGLVGQAFHFTAGQQRVRVLESTATDLSRMPRWTIEAWVRPASFVNATYPTIYSEGNRLATIGINNGTGKLESWVNNDNSRRLLSTNALTLNEWNHVALVYEGTRRLLYLNGKLDGATNTPAITDDSSGAAIGHVTVSDANSPYLGDVDELSLYNRALTADEIAALAGNPAGKCFSNAPLPAFALQPAGKTVFLGDTVTLNGIAMGTPRPDYQWLFNGAPIAGENGVTLTIANVNASRSGGYSIVAQNAFGSTTSAVAQIVVPWCSDAPTNQVAWWPADGSGLDATTDYHDGAVWGGTTYGPGVAGSAFGFNGTDAYVAVADAPELSPHDGTNGEMSVEAWIKLDELPQPDTVTGQNRRTVLAKGSPGQWEYGLSITNKAGTAVPEFSLWNPGGSIYGYVAGGTITAGEWHHLVVTLRKGESLKLYQNGNEVGSSAVFTGTTDHGTAPLYIGRRGDAQFFNGWVDEPALYSRVLTADEVAALYAADGSGRCSGAPSPAPWFARQPENQSGYLLLGAGLAAFANGTPRPGYQWSRSNATEWVELEGQTNGTLAFTNLSEEVEGNYRVVATNERGSTTSDSAYLRVVCHDIVCGGGEQFEKGWNGWEVDGGVWQVGIPIGVPNHTNNGNNVAATVLAGLYPAYSQSRLMSPPVDLPAITAGEELQLRLEHWFNYSSYDSGTVQISVFDPTNSLWGGWLDLANFAGYSAVWSRASVDLNPFAGQRVRLGFHHYATRNCGNCGSEAEGWYIDNVAVWKGVPQFHNPEGFELGQGDWSVDQGTWEFGTSGNRTVLATVLDGNYYAYGSSRAVSPPVVLPVVAAGEELQLRLEHWFNYSSYDSGTVQISVFDPTNSLWGGWLDLANFAGYSAVWSRASVDLNPFAGQRVRLGFHHYATRNCGNCGSEAEGWYIDNVAVWKGVPQFHNPEGFELGQGDWSVDQGTWEFGTSGNRTVLATVLDGNYYAYGSSRAVSPPVVLPVVAAGEELQLRLEHWFNYSSYDSGTVQISVFDPTNSLWGGWLDLANFAGYSAVWSRASVDLNPFAGQRVRLGFHHYATRNCGNCGSEAEGWYIDNVAVWKGVPQFHNPEGFELGQGDWSVDQGTWEFGTSGNRTVLATVLDGNYYAYGSSRAVSPPVVLPAVAVGEPLQLCYWETYSYAAYDAGTLQISMFDPMTEQWEPWTSLGEVTGSSGGWSRRCIDIIQFAGHQVRIGFLHSATRNCGNCGSESSGWYIDNLFIKRGNLAIASISDKTVNEQALLTFPVTVIGTTPDSCVSYQLVDAPEGATMDPNSGVFSWTPSECQGPGIYNIGIYVIDFCNNEANDLGFVKVTVNEVNEPPWLLPAEGTVYVGVTNGITLCTGDPDCPRNPLNYSLLDTVPPGMTINASNGVVSWAPTLEQIGTYTNRIRLCDGGSPNYCVTNTIVLSVTTNKYALEIQQLSADEVRFILHGGSLAVDYVLQQATELCGCPCQTVWEDVGVVSPTETPFVFDRVMDQRYRFFRLKEMPRSP